MRLREEIMINLFGQDIVKYTVLANEFYALSEEYRKEFLNGLLFLILQSKPLKDDIEPTIISSELKPTFTPCVLLRKGISQFNLRKILELPKNEQGKVLKLLITLFKISYRRRFELEKDDPVKWWYWDFSKKHNLLKLRNHFSDLTEIDWVAILGEVKHK